MTFTNHWTFHIPVQIRFGCGAVSRLPAAVSRLQPSRIAVAVSKSALKIESVRNVIEQLAPVLVFTDIQPNPAVANVDALANALRKSQADAVVALGGGSVLDCTKAAAFLAKQPDSSIRPFHSEGKPVAGECLPMIAVPTTAGTGSEVTPIAVLDDEEKNIKLPLASPLFYPKTAVVDPDLTLSVPLAVTAATALDALSHAVEGFWSKNHQPICDILAEESARIIFQHLETVLKNPLDIRGREQLSYAALLAGLAFHQPKNAVIHACSFPLSQHFHLPHGAACALTMEAAIRLNAPFMNGRMEHFIRSCGFDSVTKLNETITRFKRLGGLPCSLKEAGITPDDLPVLVQKSVHPLLNNNPKTITESDLQQLYSELL
ncbi:MAG: iron-containing alcohol dehydrogenase [Planctomycetaceae bacterium]|jgi:alcohol dehydrogenase|nr:iron-containing alcohol dehydrogenase [Planctomycetaceae bacterium]